MIKKLLLLIFFQYLVQILSMFYAFVRFANPYPFVGILIMFVMAYQMGTLLRLMQRWIKFTDYNKGKLTAVIFAIITFFNAGIGGVLIKENGINFNQFETFFYPFVFVKTPLSEIISFSFLNSYDWNTSVVFHSESLFSFVGLFKLFELLIFVAVIYRIQTFRPRNPFSTKLNKWYERKVIALNAAYIVDEAALEESLRENAVQAIQNSGKGDFNSGARFTLFYLPGEFKNYIRAENIRRAKSDGRESEFMKIETVEVTDVQAEEILKTFKFEKRNFFKEF